MAVTKVNSGGKGHVTPIKVRKSQATQIATSTPLNTEDFFNGAYAASSGSGAPIIEPPFNPCLLENLCEHNNVLAQCVETMEVNVDGTGYEAIKAGADVGDSAAEEAEKQRLEEFLEQPYPGVSFTTIRRKIRRDMERVGFGFMEVLRALDGSIVFIRHIPASTMRLVRLDEPVQVTRAVVRGGKEVEYSILVTERRYVQRVGASLRYYREFNSSRQLNAATGEWIAQGAQVQANQIATEVVYFAVNEVSSSPYGLPRWINQLPSVLGSRRAEEFNLSFFDSGGIPPALIFVNGGTLADGVRTQLQSILSGGKAGANSHRGAVVEVSANSGSLDDPGKTTVTVEKFGSTDKDAMFGNYDKSCWDHVREAFRLPPIFLGRSQDYNFATALTAMMLADGQVFEPERFAFDETFNATIVAGLGITKYKMHSLPLTVKNADNQLKGLELVKDMVSDEDFLKQVNSVTNMSMELDAQKASDAAAARKAQATQFAGGQSQPQQPAQPAAGEAAPPADGTQSQKVEVVKRDYHELVVLAEQWAVAHGVTGGPFKPTTEDRERVNMKVGSLSTTERLKFDQIVAIAYFDCTGSDRHDVAKLAHSAVNQMCGCGDVH